MTLKYGVEYAVITKHYFLILRSRQMAAFIKILALVRYLILISEPNSIKKR